MTGVLLQAKGSTRVRAGTYALSLLSDPLNALILKKLATGSTPLADLRVAAGSPPQTTMRGHLKALTDSGILERRRQREFPGAVEYELRTPGHELLAVSGVLEAWLANAPNGPVGLGSPDAKGSIKAMAEGWSSTIVRALAARPLSLTELNRLISSMNYPTIERRLCAMRLAGLIESCPGQGRGSPYGPSEWLRRAIAPLAASALWERRNAPAEVAPIGRLDVEASFLLVIPMLDIPGDISGPCRLTVEQRSDDGENRLAGVMVEANEGRVVSCVTALRGHADGWASGSPDAWLAAVIEGDTSRLEIGGNWHLATALLDGLHRTLFGLLQDA